MRHCLGPRSLSPGILVLACGIAVACGGGGDSNTTQTAGETATPRPTSPAVTATQVPLPVATATPAAPQVASTAWLIDAEAKQVRVITERVDDSIWKAEFGPGGDTIVVYLGGDTETYDFNGAPVASAVPLTCEDIAGGAAIGDRVYAGVRCGIISPNQEWMYYAVEVSQRTYDAFLLELESGGSTRIQEGLRLDLGGDWYFGPAWSPSGRYLMYPEHMIGGRVWLTDAETQKTRLLEGLHNDRDEMPVWSPVSDQLLMLSNGEAAILDAATGERRERQLAWPARWDTTGSFLYSPAWAPWMPEPNASTTIMEAATGRVLATLAGVPSWTAAWIDLVTVVAAADGRYTAALERADDCPGTLISSTLRSDSICVEQGAGGAVSPDGTKVAVAILVGPEAGEFVTPYGGPPRAMSRYQILMVDVTSGAGTLIESDAYSTPPHYESGNQEPPAITWNAQGTHVLVTWPRSYGL